MTSDKLIVATSLLEQNQKQTIVNFQSQTLEYFNRGNSIYLGFLAALKSHPSIFGLDLSRTNVSTAAEILSNIKPQTLVQLRINYSLYGRADNCPVKDFEIFTAFLSKCSSLQLLQANDLFIEFEDHTKTTKTLMNIPASQLISLDFAGNKSLFSQNTVLNLSILIANSPNLQSINIESNNLGQFKKEAKETITNIANLPILRFLKLSNNNICLADNSGSLEKLFAGGNIEIIFLDKNILPTTKPGLEKLYGAMIKSKKLSISTITIKKDDDWHTDSFDELVSNYSEHFATLSIFTGDEASDQQIYKLQTWNILLKKLLNFINFNNYILYISESNLQTLLNLAIKIAKQEDLIFDKDSFAKKFEIDSGKESLEGCDTRLLSKFLEHLLCQDGIDGTATREVVSFFASNLELIKYCPSKLINECYSTICVNNIKQDTPVPYERYWDLATKISKVLFNPIAEDNTLIELTGNDFFMGFTNWDGEYPS